jgi:hypothetical protein
MSLPEHRLLYLRSDAFERVFAGYTATEDALLSTENVEKYVACVCCVAGRRSKPESIGFCGWTRKSQRVYSSVITYRLDPAWIFNCT